MTARRLVIATDCQFATGLRDWNLSCGRRRCDRRKCREITIVYHRPRRGARGGELCIVDARTIEFAQDCEVAELVLEGDLGSTKHGEISRLPWRGKSIAHEGDNENVSGDPVERMTSRKVGPDFLIWRRTTGKSGENEDS